MTRHNLRNIEPPTRPAHGELELWRLLDQALAYLNNAEFELQRGHSEDAGVWVGDARRALGEAALVLADQHASVQEGYRRFAEQIVTPPHVRRPQSRRAEQ